MVMLKSNKCPTDPDSYRIKSLLCNPVRVLEKLILERIWNYLPFPPSKHGFRAHQSTVTLTLLTTVNKTALDGLDSSKPAYRTLLAVIDIRKAFGTVYFAIFIQRIFSTDMNTYLGQLSFL